MKSHLIICALFLFTMEGMGQAYDDEHDTSEFKWRPNGKGDTLKIDRSILPANMFYERGGRYFLILDDVKRELLSPNALVGYWDEWSDSCWADSTWEDRAGLIVASADSSWPDCPITEKWNWPRGDGKLLDLTHNVVRLHCYHAIRRDPNDLLGFMEFIKRRTK